MGDKAGLLLRKVTATRRYFQKSLLATVEREYSALIELLCVATNCHSVGSSLIHLADDDRGI